MKNKKKIYISVAVLIVLSILIMPTIVWMLMPKVETSILISLTKEGTLLPKSVVELGESPHVFQLVHDSSFWNDGFIAKRIDVKVIESDEDSVTVSDIFHPDQELIIIGNINLHDGIHVRR